jgi:hypothetical protein
MTLTLDPDRAARKLTEWFTGLRDRLDRTVFAVGGDEPHRKAAALTSVSRHVALFEAASVESGAQIREAASVLAGATRALGLEAPDQAQWLAAARNVASVDAQLHALDPSPWVGEDAAAIFREHFVEALRQAGVARVPTILDAANRRTALGLAVNWGMRYLVAAAASSDPDPGDAAASEVVAAVKG